MTIDLEQFVRLMSRLSRLRVRLRYCATCRRLCSKYDVKAPLWRATTAKIQADGSGYACLHAVRPDLEHGAEASWCRVVSWPVAEVI